MAIKSSGYRTARSILRSPTPHAPPRSMLWLSLVGILVSVILGGLATLNPVAIGLLVVIVVLLCCCWQQFERTVLGLLILRSSLDAFSVQQIPAAFAIGLNVLTLAYIVLLLLAKRRVQVDRFGGFLAAWVIIQAIWVILLPLGGLGGQAAWLMVGVREWVRIFSGLMVYLLVMQLKGRVPPQRIVMGLFYSLLVPLTAATLQVLLPPSRLPSFLVFQSGYAIEAGSRMNGTLGHPNVFASFLVLFLSLTLWQVEQAKQRSPWLVLAAVLAFFLVSTQSLTGLVMLFVFIPAFLVRRVSVSNLLGGAILIGLVAFLFFNSELGQERLQTLYGTPLLNPRIDASRAILLQWTDGNSFNWRVAQWTFLLEAWQRSPLLGYGLDTSRFLTVQASFSHNDYIRFLVESGVIGFCLFLIFLAAQFVRLYQVNRSPDSTPAQRSLCSIMMAFWLALMVGMLAGNIWNHTTLFFYWWTIMAVLGWDWQATELGTSSETPLKVVQVKVMQEAESR